MIENRDVSVIAGTGDNMDMTSGSLGRQILRFSVPIMISNLLQVFFNISDIAIVGKFSGSEALGAVGSTTILISLFTGFLIGLGSGVNVLAARYLGQKNDTAVREVVHSSAIICFIFGMALLIIGIAFSGALLELMNTKEELLEGAKLYLRIYFLGMPALAVYNFGNAVLSAAGDTKRPLYYLIAAGIINIALNLFFVIVLKRSVDGVAMASIISQYISAALIVLFLVKNELAYGLSAKYMRLSGKHAADILKLGLLSGFQNAIFAIANLFIQTGVNSFDAVTVEGNAAAANADPLVYDVMAAFYMACSTFMSQNYGAGNKKRVIKSYYISLAYSFGAGAVLGVALVVFGDRFLSISTNEQQVIDEGMARLKVMGFSYAISAFMDCTIAASRGLGKTIVPTAIVIMGSCVFRIVWIYTVFAYFQTIFSLYLLYAFSWAITAVAEIIYFAVIYKKTACGAET